MNLYFECNTGAAGDMLASVLVSLFDDKEKITAELNSLSLPHTVIKYGEKAQNGINGAHLEIIINGEKEEPDGEHHSHHHHHGRSLEEIYSIIDSLNVGDKVKKDIKSIYGIVAEAEAQAHGAPVGEIHFHELGMLDAIADITVSAYLIEKLNIGKIYASPINVGNGTVKCAHGVLPVPAPATANILVGVPYYKSDINTELCTPTGAAVLKYFCDGFTESPRLDSVKKIGIGSGTKELKQANILRAFLYEEETVTELSCNIDDMTGEETAFATEIIMKEGALDCFVTPVFMKKGRPAYLLTVLCNNADAENFAALIFKHTTTIGIRKYAPSRYTLERELKDEGVPIKRSEGYGTAKEKIEFENIKALALEKNVSVFEARKELEEQLK
ncbi:MAG: nickel pincer cofactor biosynthesis protein LarC [Eubacterium sp.]|nr:nickel pincer cofactor biosynthesis protein LarC [Eubacterium sp.]